ncbi:MAG TPA: M48 family metallopeptidase [Gemmatimonadales bacterium]
MTRALHLRRRVAIAGLALLVACTVSEDQEKEMGADYARQINAQLPLVRDPAITGYVEALGREIARTSPREGLEWRFYVVDAPEVNAFAVPGGYVYVNRGLIERMDRMDELAGVLAHEVGHVSLRHSAKQMEKQGKANVGLTVFCTLTNICSGDVARVAINVAGSAWFAKHSREDEAQADSIAVFSLPQAGIDPEGIPAMFDKLLAERQADPGVLQGWFGTHPLEEDRIARTRELIASLPPAGAPLARDDREFAAVRDRLRALPPSPAPRELPPPQ